MTSQMRASAREMRHMVGRYLHARNCPAYAVNAVRDAIMAAQACGYDAVSFMEEIRNEYPEARTSFAVEVVGDALTLDGIDTPAPLLAPAFLDELALAQAQGRNTVYLVNVPGLAMFSALHEYAAVRGISFVITHDSDLGASATSATVTVAATPATPVEPASGAAGPAMEHILRAGYELDSEQFWRLFHESNGALTPDSELSRRHAGSQLYDEDGNLIGEVSEETYLHLRNASAGSTSAVLA